MRVAAAHRVDSLAARVAGPGSGGSGRRWRQRVPPAVLSARMSWSIPNQMIILGDRPWDGRPCGPGRRSARGSGPPGGEVGVDPIGAGRRPPPGHRGSGLAAGGRQTLRLLVTIATLAPVAGELPADGGRVAVELAGDGSLRHAACPERINLASFGSGQGVGRDGMTVSGWSCRDWGCHRAPVALIPPGNRAGPFRANRLRSERCTSEWHGGCKKE